MIKFSVDPKAVQDAKSRPPGAIVVGISFLNERKVLTLYVVEEERKMEKLVPAVFPEFSLTVRVDDGKLNFELELDDIPDRVYRAYIDPAAHEEALSTVARRKEMLIVLVNEQGRVRKVIFTSVTEDIQVLILLALTLALVPKHFRRRETLH